MGFQSSDTGSLAFFHRGSCGLVAVLAVHHRPPGYGRNAQESTLAFIVVQKASSKLKMDVDEFFTEYGEANRYQIREVIGKGSYGVVCSGELVHLQPSCTQHAS